MKSEIRDTGIDFLSELDERIFGKDSLSTRLFKYFISMAMFMILIPALIGFSFSLMHMEEIFYYISVPFLSFIILIFFMVYSIREILRPIKHILTEVRKLQEGNLDVNLDIDGYVEVRSLAKSIDRMRNSLFIATAYLGKRDDRKDRIIQENISIMNLYLIFLAPFLIYGITLTMLSAVLFSDIMANIMASIPFWTMLRALLVILYGVIMALSLGYILARTIGSAMRKIAVAAEEASRGNMDADFTVKKNLGYIYELSIRLNDLKEAIKRAMEEMEGEVGD